MAAESLRDKLASEVLAASWLDLAPHHARGALVLADGQLDLVDVAVAIASDDGEAVQRWMAAGQLARAAPALAEAWANEAPAFHAVIVQPFVVAQPLASS